MHQQSNTALISEKNVTDRVKSKKTEKILKFIYIGYALLVGLPLSMIAINFEHISTLKFSDLKPFILGLTLLSGLYLQLKRKTGQFIEWSPEGIQFKTGYVSIAVTKEQIDNIEIRLDSVLINKKDGESLTVNLQDFSNYEDRLRIKQNFEQFREYIVK